MKCTKCGNGKRINETPKLTDHEPVTEYVEECYGKGNRLKCDICHVNRYADDFERYVEPQHEWGEVEFTQKPTCLWEGFDRVRCAKCNNTQTINIVPKLTDHAPKSEYVENCDGKGNRLVCNICNVSQNTRDFVRYDEPQHTWGEVEYTQKPSCLNEGFDEVRCIKCGQWNRQNFTPKLTDHAAPTEPITTENCEGITTRLWCDICNDGIPLKFDRFPEPKHNWKFLYAQGATCMQEGADVLQCANCGWRDYTRGCSHY